MEKLEIIRGNETIGTGKFKGINLNGDLGFKDLKMSNDDLFMPADEKLTFKVGEKFYEGFITKMQKGDKWCWRNNQNLYSGLVALTKNPDEEETLSPKLYKRLLEKYPEFVLQFNIDLFTEYIEKRVKFIEEHPKADYMLNVADQSIAMFERHIAKWQEELKELNEKI